MKTIKNLFKQDKEKFVIPRSVQDTIPVKTIYKDGIFEVSKGKYSICYRFTDINYAVASRPDKEAEVLKILSIDNKEYVIYSVDNGDDTSDIFTSEIIKDEEGYDKLIDIEDEKTKQNLLEIINIIFS